LSLRKDAPIPRDAPARLLQWPRVMRVLLRIVQTALQLCPASAAWALARRFSIRADGKSSQADRDFGSAKVATRTDNRKLPTTAAARGRARLQLYALVPPRFFQAIKIGGLWRNQGWPRAIVQKYWRGLRLEALTGMQNSKRATACAGRQKGPAAPAGRAAATHRTCTEPVATILLPN